MISILLVDVSSIAHQMPVSMAKLTTSDGRLSGHVYSYTRYLKTINNNLDFNSVFYVLDGGSDKRYKIDPNYKGNRKGKPAIVDDVIPLHSHIPGFVVQKEGYEADDLIYTLSRLLCSEFEVIILAKDYDISYNLISYPKVRHFFNPTTEITFQALFMQYGCAPANLPLYKAIYGDSSDNIPSIKLPRKISLKIKKMFLENKSPVNIGKHIPKEYKHRLLINLNLTRPFFITEFNLSEGICSRQGIENFLQSYEIKSIVSSDLIPPISKKETETVKHLLLHGK